MIKNKFLLYLLCGVTMSPALALGECKPTQDCRALGYKEAPCPEQGVKCPFGETWYCPLRCKDGQVWKDGKCTDVLGSCSGAAKNCKIGQILNSDASCSDNKVSGKTPIGVVVHVSPEGCGWAITAMPAAEMKAWSMERVNTGVFRSDDRQQIVKDFDVKGNMDKIIQTANDRHGDNAAKFYPAAYAALNYMPSEVPTTKGKWMLPSAGILNNVCENLDIVNKAISKLSGIQLRGDVEYIWSSSEYNTAAAWYFTASYYYNGECLNEKNKSATQGGITYYVVRPVIEF